MLYVYYAKDQQELEDVGSKSIMGGRFVKINDPARRNILAVNGSVNNANLDLKHGLEQESTPAGVAALKRFMDDFNNRMPGLSEKWITFFIHFGSQNPEASRRLTTKMRDAVKAAPELSGYRFLAVSRHHEHPIGFFKEKRFILPDEVVIEWALRESNKGSLAQPCPHLRALVILCQSLLQLSEEERMKKIRSEAWRKNFGWEVVDGKSRDFTDKENDFWVKSENFRDLMSCTDRICTKKLEIRDAQEKTIREIINVCLVMIGK